MSTQKNVIEQTEKKKNGASRWGFFFVAMSWPMFSLGALSLIFVPLFNFVGFILGIVGLARNRKKYSGQGMGVFTLIMSLVTLAIYALAVSNNLIKG